MASIVEICNIALTRFGAATITSLDEASKEARQCKLVFENIRDTVLRAYPWGFSTSVVVLAVNSDVTIPGWNYAYSYPSDCLLARKIFNATMLNILEPQSKKIVGTTSGRVILSNIEQAYLEYTKRVTDPTMFDPEFVNALAWKLAADMAKPISGDADLGKYCFQQYSFAVDSAQLSDAVENTEPVEQSCELIQCRW